VQKTRSRARFVKDRQSAARDYVQFVIDSLRTTPTDLARQIKVGPSTLTRLLNSADLSYSLKLENLVKISEFSRIPLPEAVRSAYGISSASPPVSRLEVQSSTGEPSNVQQAPYINRDSPRKAVFDIPVMGTARGGSEGSFLLNMGEAIDWVRRPPALEGKAGLYAIYVEGDSMSPRFYAGERVLVSTKQPPKPGSDVVIQIKPTSEGAPITAYLKSLVRQNSEEVVVEQFNPPRQMKFKRAQIESLHTVLNRDETF
jgi:phage repressor protein C with HTH and peptisase S24 domain